MKNTIMNRIDFHTHILPDIDDGARNVDVSIEMLKQITSQQIDTIIATPHFYASRDRLDKFLQKRKGAWDAFSCTIEEKKIEKSPEILLGSEVAFFDGISRAEQICELTVQGTNLLLLEMPFVTWTEANIREVEKLIRDFHLTVMIAHVERFLRIPGNKKEVQRLLELPVIVQMNAEALLDWRHRRAYLKMIKDGTVHVLGSDCHGIHHRVPNLSEARDLIEKKLGSEMLEKIDRTGTRLLKEVLE